jgi:hypothetical protein
VNTPADIDFPGFLAYFPELTLPASLLPDLSVIPSDTPPVPGAMIDTYILPFEASEQDDEYTEYVPYGRLAGPKDFHAVVYWKAGVLRYEFILATYSPSGDPLSHAIIGGLRYEDEGALHSVSVIHDDLRITIAEGLLEDGALVGETTQSYHMMIAPDGIITYETNEEEKE